MHASSNVPSMRTKKVGTLVTSLYVSTLCLQGIHVRCSNKILFNYIRVFYYSIVDFEDPKDRMIQVLKWYLSAFHAGRKVR
jgi:hypothetical protein